jgi:hypothetical protein
MSIGASAGSSKSKTKTDPWAPTQPILKDLVAEATPLVGNTGVTAGQQGAFDQLKANAAAGNPAAGQIRDVATGALTYDNTGQKDMVSGAYGDLQKNLGAYASGDYLDVANNPQLKALMDVVGTDISDRINRQFAGAGRDLSGMNQQSVARGVSQGTAGLLLDQFNKQQQMQMGAAGQLFQGATGAAGQMSQLDQLLQQIRGSGIGHADKALTAENYGPNAILALEQQMKNMPVEDLALIASLITPIAGLGGDSSTKGSSTSLGIKLG